MPQLYQAFQALQALTTVLRLYLFIAPIEKINRKTLDTAQLYVI
jgi:hypothetical protein